MIFLPFTFFIALVAETNTAGAPTPCPIGDCWQCNPVRLLKMMYELNVSPLGEIYEATAPVEDHVFRKRTTSSNGHQTKGFLGVEKDNARSLKQDVVVSMSMSMSMTSSEEFAEVELDFMMTGVNSKSSKPSKESKSKNKKSSDPSSNPSESPSSDPSESSDPSSNPSETPSSDPSEIPSSDPSSTPSENKKCETNGPPTTYEACCGQGPTCRLSKSEVEDEIVDDAKGEEEPWTAPNQPMAELIAKNPGIWKIPDFINLNLVQRMLETFENDERFERCNGEAHDHLKCKQCFRLSPSSSRDTEEEELTRELIQKVEDLWPSLNKQRDYLYVQRTEPDCDGTLVHKDVTEQDFSKSATATVVFYLSDGGAGVFFPSSNVIIPPKAGMAVTWLNVHEDGSRNVVADHGIQATPKDASIRYSLTYRITLSDEEMAASRKK